MSSINQSRDSDFSKRMALNITIVGIVGFIFITTSTVLLQQFSICNFLFIAIGSKEFLLRRISSLTGKQLESGLEQRYNSKTINSIMTNASAFWFAFVLFVLHPFECCGIFFLVYRFWRQDWHWDFSMFDSSLDAYVYIGILVSIGVIVTIMNGHILHFWCLKKKSTGNPIVRQLKCYVSSKETWYVEV
jgi:hypothetical protein